ncbi:MAG: glycosyl transferase [Spirochaetia bacterium]|nr:glycosyl transferase [Spirochaetota bacterium]MDW8113196.1 glycosyl transferase [Spirochaetia bacterium]
MIYIFTSIAANYLPKARVLAKSLKKFHPEFKLYLVIDKIPEWFELKSEPFDDFILYQDLNIPNFKSWIFKYSLLEMCTAVKPYVFLHLFQNDPSAVLYFDPDIVVFSRLDDLIEYFNEFSILLTPHQTEPETIHDAIIDNEICSLNYGIFNLGFIGVKNDSEGKKFAHWWADRLDRFCYAELNKGLWVDQKWINLVPCFFEKIKIIRSPRFNVAPWNLTTRKLYGNFEKGFFVDDKPLGFYHFTGFDSKAHEIMVLKYAGDNEAVKELIKWYKLQIKDDKAANLPFAYAHYQNFENGEPIQLVHRIIYRMRRDLQEIYSDPFKVIPNGKCFYNWFKWRAHIEHPDIIKNYLSKASNEIETKTTFIKDLEIIIKRIYRSCKKSIRDKNYRKYLYNKIKYIIKTEGIKGLVKEIFSNNK